MTTLVFHGSTLGVTEYSTQFTALAQDHEATAGALFTVGGPADDGTPILSAFALAATAEDGGRLRMADCAYVQADTAAQLVCTVSTGSSAATYPYPAERLGGRTQRFKFGRGIQDGYIGFKISNPDGQAFAIDHAEFVTHPSKQRRI